MVMENRPFKQVIFPFKPPFSSGIFQPAMFDYQRVDGIWRYPKPYFHTNPQLTALDHITRKYGIHFTPPSIRPLGLRGKELGWLADDLQTKTQFGYSKCSKCIQSFKNAPKKTTCTSSFHMRSRAKAGGFWFSHTGNP